ncbi:MAG: class I SAM-dependent methyltransferase [Bacillota bacterium]
MLNPVVDLFEQIYSRPVTEVSSMQRELATLLLKHCPGASYLEVGAGTGLVSHILSQNNISRVAAVDLADAAVRQLRSLGTLDVYQADMFELPFDDRTYEVVWNAGVLEHYPPEDQVRALREMTRISSRWVLAAVPNAHCIPYQLGKLAGQITGKWPYGPEDSYYSLAPQFRKCGLFLVDEFSACRVDALWFMDEYLPGWRGVVPVNVLGDAGYLLVSIGAIKDL